MAGDEAGAVGGRDPIDPYQPYATAVATHLPDARLVVDHFRVVRLGQHRVE